MTTTAIGNELRVEPRAALAVPNADLSLPMPLDPARSLALDRLLRLEADRAYVARLADTDADDLSDPRAERQALDYVAGVTRHKRYLDFLIAHFYRGDAATLEAALRQALRIGLYDLLFLDTPPHAAVHEAVELAKQRIRPGAGGLTNGLLRAATRGPLPEPNSGDPADDLAVRHSQPTWIVRRWLARYGPDETRALLDAANARPRYALRVNTLRESVADVRAALDELEVAHEPSRYLDDFVIVDRLQPVLRAGWLDDGRCAVQDEAAGLVVRLLDPQPGETVADVAAAPGGKAIYAAMRMQDEGTVLAFDIHATRTDLVQHAAAAHGLTSVQTEVADLRLLAARERRPQADAVLLDAPCSGFGVLAKRADLRWQRSPEEITELVALQDDLLDAAARLVRPGGRLVYATCSIEPDENAERVTAFLGRNPEFSVESAEGFVPGEMVTDEGFYAALPHRHGTDGAFAARLRRRG